MTADVITLRSAIVERLIAAGLDMPRALARAGLPPFRFKDEKAALSTREFFAFWRAVHDASTEPDAALKFGAEAAQPHRADLSTLAMLHSPTLGDALTKLARYKRLCLPEEVRIDVADGEARVSYHWLHAVEDAPLMLIDGVFAHVLALARQGVGTRLVPLRVELARRRANPTVLRAHFGCEIIFDAAVDRIVFDEASLALPFRMRNAALYDFLLPQLEAAISAQDAPSTPADDVKNVLRRRMNGERPSVDKVAEAVRFSPRTLQRKLSEQQTSYQRLLDDVRRTTGLRLLADTDLDVGEIAFLLGFDEVNSFTRAFRTWERQTPGRWRAAARA